MSRAILTTFLLLVTWCEVRTVTLVSPSSSWSLITSSPRSLCTMDCLSLLLDNNFGFNFCFTLRVSKDRCRDSSWSEVVCRVRSISCRDGESGGRFLRRLSAIILSLASLSSLSVTQSPLSSLIPESPEVTDPLLEPVPDFRFLRIFLLSSVIRLRSSTTSVSNILSLASRSSVLVMLATVLWWALSHSLYRSETSSLRWLAPENFLLEPELLQ